MLTIGQENFRPIEIDAGSEVRAVTFSANGKYIVSGDNKKVRVWRVDDWKQLAKIETGIVNCVAVSNDGKWIAAGTQLGDVFVWDAATFRLTIKHSEHEYIHGVDFSPDSMRLVSATYKKAIVWDMVTRKQIQTLEHQNYVIVAKYSPRGNYIVTATREGPIHVWDSSDGHLIVEIKVEVTLWWNKGILWFNDHLLVVSGGKIKQLDASTGSPVSEWPVGGNYYYSEPNIALPKHKEFITYSTHHSLSLWDTSTHSRLALHQHPRAIRSIAFSPDDRFLAIGGEDGKITIESLSRIAVSSVSANHDLSESEQLYSPFRIGFNPIVSSTPHLPGT